MKSLKLYLLIIPFLIVGCSPEKKLEQGEGFVDTPNGQVWYRIVGSGEGTPLLLLHGGPGFTSHYLNPMNALGNDRPIIFVDQLGAGRSASMTDTTLMTIDHFMEVVRQVKSTLGLEKYFVYGHSWGTMLAMDYYLKYPDGIKGIVFASPLFSTAMWTQDAEKLILELPDSVQQAIAMHTANGTYDTPGYQEAMNSYYTRYTARKLPWDANLDSTFAQFNFDIYNYMWGPSEFKSTGTLKNFDRLEEAKKVEVPALFLCGTYDESQPATVEYYHQLVPHSKFKIVENSAHVLTHDNPEQHNEFVREFLLEVDQ